MNDALRISAFMKRASDLSLFLGRFLRLVHRVGEAALAATDREVALPAWRNIFAALEAALRLLHPVMPFLTEELWHRLPQTAGARSIALDHFPEPRAEWTDADSGEGNGDTAGNRDRGAQYSSGDEARSEGKVAADFSMRMTGTRRMVEENLEPILRLAALSGLSVSSGHLDSTGAAVRSTAQFDLRIAYGEVIDKQAEIAQAEQGDRAAGEGHRIEKEPAGG